MVWIKAVRSRDGDPVSQRRSALPPLCGPMAQAAEHVEQVDVRVPLPAAEAE